MAAAAAQLNALADLAHWCFPVACHVTKDSCTLLALLLQRAGWQTCLWWVTCRSLLIMLDAGDSGVDR